MDDLDLVKDYQREYTNLLRWMYNRVRDGVKEKEREHLSHSLNNLSLLDSWFVRSAAKQAQWTNDVNKDRVVVFGGRKNLIRRCKGLISREDFLEKRLMPLASVGEAQVKGNRKFRLSENLDKVVFKPNKVTRLDLVFDGVSKTLRRVLERLFICQEAKSLPITYQVSQTHVYIMFDEGELWGYEGLKKVKDRVLAIDVNPNYVGWSVVDWKSSSSFSVVAQGAYSLKAINDKEEWLLEQHLPSDDNRLVHLCNKRRHEVLQVSKNLVDKALHYKCELFSVEDLAMVSSDKEMGRKYNRLVNNKWCRERLLKNIEKRCNIFRIKILKVVPNFSSFVGNVVFRSLGLPDMVLSSIEIGRRAYEFKKQYIEKTERQRKNIVFPSEEDFGGLIAKSLEEFGSSLVGLSLKDVFYALKKSRFRYRLSLDEVPHPMFSRFFSKRSLILKYNTF